MIILGIDPGIERLGWAVTSEDSGKPRAHGYGCFTTPRSDTVPDRLFAIHTEVLRLIRAYSPDAVAIEQILFQKNVKTAIVVSQARGVCLVAAAAGGIPVVEQTPSAIKLALTGYGKADKRQVQEMVKIVFQLNEIPRPDDAADALAIAFAGQAAHNFLQSTQKRYNR